MANNDDNPRRNRDRLGDNIFIAFRRFADSQVSSLLNTVFTLPATIANHNNAHQAREACLFNKADKSQCNKLREIEAEIAELRNEGCDLYRVGDLQEVLKKSEELMRLDRLADNLRREIVGESSRSAKDDAELIQKVANRKGQEWGWDWSWGFPKPFDEDDQSPFAKQAREDENRQQCLERSQELFQRMKAEVREMFGDDMLDQTFNGVELVFKQHPVLRGVVAEKDWDDFRKFMKTEQEDEEREWRAPSNGSLLRIPPPGDLQKRADLMRAHQEENISQYRPAQSSGEYPKRVPWSHEQTNDEPSYEYSHDHEDQHDDPPTPKVGQEAFTAAPVEPKRPGSCDATWEDDNVNKFLHDQEQKGRYLGVCDCPRPGTTSQDREDIWKYLEEEAAKNGRHFGFSDCPRPGTTSQEREDMGRFLQEQQANGRHIAVRDCPRPNNTNEERADIDKYLQEEQERNVRTFAFRHTSQSDETASEDDSPAETELDAYEHVLAKPQPPPQPAKHNVQPSILSTLTTTERSVAPDGSVTTKVVLKKRFSDGREESSETIHTQRGQDQSEARDPWAAFQKSMAPRDEPKSEQQPNEKEQKKGGWFWSR